ncbi:MAG TPA: formimidoylglutamate deiminase [Acetobacteraceae bacterium]
MPSPDHLFLETALLPSGWAGDVLIGYDGAGLITSVTTDAAPPASAERLRGIALPGVPNLHSHAPQRAIAGLGERSGSGTDSFWSWREAMYRAVARTGPDELQAIATQLYVEMLQAGYTTVAEFHYLHHDLDGRPYADPAEMSHRLIVAARIAGIRLTLLPVLYVTGGFGGAAPVTGQRRFLHDLPGFQRLVQQLRDDAAGMPAVTVGVAPHSLRAVNPDLLVELAAATPTGPIHIHVAEQQREVEECLAVHRRRPVELLSGTVALDERWCLIHATHIDTAETNAIARSGAVVGLCPTTEANLGDGLFPAEAYMAAGGRLGIGSDSHISVSPVEELRWLEYGQRLSSQRRAVLSGGAQRSVGRTLLDTTLAGGAQACGGGGTLAVGQPADIVLLDAEHPLLAARGGDAVLDAWVFAGNASLVRHVVVGGQVVVRDRYHREQDAAARSFIDTLRRLAE